MNATLRHSILSTLADSMEFAMFAKEDWEQTQDGKYRFKGGKRVVSAATWGKFKSKGSVGGTQTQTAPGGASNTAVRKTVNSGVRPRSNLTKSPAASNKPPAPAPRIPIHPGTNEAAKATQDLTRLQSLDEQLTKTLGVKPGRDASTTSKIIQKTLIQPAMAPVRLIDGIDDVLGNVAAWFLQKSGHAGLKAINYTINSAVGRLFNADRIAGVKNFGKRATIGTVLTTQHDRKTGDDVRAEVGDSLNRVVAKLRGLVVTGRQSGLFKMSLQAVQKFTGYFDAKYRANVKKFGAPLATAVEIAALAITVTVQKLMPALVGFAVGSIGGSPVGGIGGAISGFAGGGLLVNKALDMAIKAGTGVAKELGYEATKGKGVSSVKKLTRWGLEKGAGALVGAVHGKPALSAVRMRQKAGGALNLDPTTGKLAQEGASSAIPWMAKKIAKKYHKSGQAVPENVKRMIDARKRRRGVLVIHSEDGTDGLQGMAAEIMQALREHVQGLNQIEGCGHLPPPTDDELLPFLTTGLESTSKQLAAK